MCDVDGKAFEEVSKTNFMTSVISFHEIMRWDKKSSRRFSVVG